MIDVIFIEKCLFIRFEYRLFSDISLELHSIEA